MCINPIQNKDGKQYSCGKCEQCHNRYIQHWTFRLQNELKYSKKSLFLTLTYDYDHVPMNRGKFTLNKTDYQKFLKRLRKALPDRKIKYVVAGEYGTEKGRPHYHLLMFGIDHDDFNTINACWGKGTINVGSVEKGSIAYVFKYSVKGTQKALDWRQSKQFVSMSKGLGEDFAFNIQIQKNTYMNKYGHYIQRQQKLRTPKPHFVQKLDTLLKMPYYQLPSDKGGVVKMSIPRFYLDQAKYDKTELTEAYLDKIQTKYDEYPEPLKQVIFEREQIQRSEAPSMWERKVNYTLSKEKNL